MNKHEIVMYAYKPSCWRLSVVFFPEDKGNLGLHTLPFETWEDMGSPMTITITVEPGDKLNKENDGQA